MLAVIMRVVAVVLMVVCAAGLDHRGGHDEPPHDTAAAATAASCQASAVHVPAPEDRHLSPVDHVDPDHPCSPTAKPSQPGGVHLEAATAGRSPSPAATAVTALTLALNRDTRSVLSMTGVYRT